MRDATAIKERFNERRGRSMFGFDLEVLGTALGSKGLQELLPDIDPAALDELSNEPMSENRVFLEAVDYLEFALGKALGPCHPGCMDGC